MPEKLLTRVYDQIKSNQVDAAMQDLLDGLRGIRLNSSGDEWGRMVQSKILIHPIKDLIHADPLTRRSFYKPRGYAGDAVLLDMIYRHPGCNPEETSELGRSIMEFLSNDGAARAVRYRRAYVARLIDSLADQKENPKVMSVACGHLREFDLSHAARDGALRDFMAIDQDSKSLESVRRDYAQHGVTSSKVSVSDIVGQKFNPEGLDLIYSSGLYDYLNQRLAQMLTKRLFAMLADGGVLLLTNFLPAIGAVGYMESYMAWHLIFRDESEMMALVRGIPRNQIDRVELFVEKQQNIVFLQVHKSL